MSNNARKRYIWEVHGYVYSLQEGLSTLSMIFTNKYKATSHIRCTILIYLVSSIDHIFLTNMQALGVRDEDIFEKEISLVGFNSSTTYDVGIFLLPLMVIGSIIMKKNCSYWHLHSLQCNHRKAMDTHNEGCPLYVLPSH